jgi:hypothetical protein
MTREEFEEKYKDKTVFGFEFENTHPAGYGCEMDRYVGVDGLIFDYRDDLNSFDVSFEDGESWLYPMDECIRQIEENNKSEEDLYVDIYMLLKSI